MMHQANTVVFISDLQGRPFREFEHMKSHDSAVNPLGVTSRARVVMPFDTEYRFNFKFDDGRRRRLELTIDGSLVAKDLIVSSGSFLERFLDSDRRFKVAPVTAVGVADPTSPDNGSVVVKLWAEKRPFQTFQMNCLRSMSLPRGSSAVDHSLFECMGGMLLSSSEPSLSAFGDTVEKAATVEGAKSSQRFGHTNWSEEDPIPEVFLFTLQGKREGAVNASYCSSCGSPKAQSSARFCHQCGEKLPC